MNEIILKRIEDLCLENGITKSRLSKDIGLSRNTINNWRYQNPSRTCLSKIATYFGVTIEYVKGETDLKTIEDISEDVFKEIVKGIETGIINEENAGQRIYNIILQIFGKEACHMLELLNSMNYCGRMKAISVLEDYSLIGKYKCVKSGERYQDEEK